MPSPRNESSDRRIAESLDLKPGVYRHLRNSLQEGEFPVWLRTGDPRLAGQFTDAFAFEMLCERMHAQEALDRRRHNLASRLAENEKTKEAEMAESAQDEGRLEDLGFVLDSADAPEGVETPEKEEHAKFLAGLRVNAGLAMALRSAFRRSGELNITATGKEGVEVKPYQDLVDFKGLISSFAPARYLLLRRGERAHAVQVEFSLPKEALASVFEKESGYPIQERDSYRSLFDGFVQNERLPRFVQEARAQLKRSAETGALQHAWENIEFSVDRGIHPGCVAGVGVMKGKVHLAFLSSGGELLKSGSIPSKGDNLAERILKFFGEEAPTLVAFQGDTQSRNAAQKLVKKLRAEDKQARAAMIPVPVVKTMVREVARRGAESLLGHDERQVYLLAVFAHNPRAAVLHTPHIARAFIAYRGEFNSRRLEEFETTFLRNLLVEHGADVNQAPPDVLGLVPGVSPRGVELERSTAPFLSLEDFQDRMGLSEPAWRAASGLLRVKAGADILDSRPLQPMYYGALRQVLDGSDLSLGAALKTPQKLRDLNWDSVLESRGWKPSVVRLIVDRLQRSIRKRRAPRPKGKGLDMLQVGDVVKGKVTSVAAYGAFVSIGARCDGLVHVSHLSDDFVKDPKEVVKVGQDVSVRILSVDVEKSRFRLSMKSETASQEAPKSSASSAHRSTRPKGRPGGNRAGGPDGGHGGRDDFGGGGGKGRGKKEKLGPDPKKEKKEEFDPTNPFFVFFQNKEDEAESK